MANITEREFKASYELGIEVYKKKISIEDAIARLVDDYQMNEASANISINFLQHMLNAKEYKRTLSTSHVKYYANRILEDFGVEKLKIFLKGLELHIKYRQSMEFKVPAFCDIHTEYSQEAGVSPIFSKEEAMADRIPLEQIEACYKAGKKFYKNEITLEDAVAEAVASGIDENYAKSNIRFLISMLNGELRTRPVINGTIKCYLENVLRDFGKERLKIFLKGLELHIKHRQSIGFKIPTFCDTHIEYSEKAGVPPVFQQSKETIAKKMEPEHFEVCYELGKQVYEEKISIEDAADELVDDYQMNESSAKMYINFFLCMMRGEVYERSINQDGLRCYCENVLRDYGVEQLKIFLKGLKLHIEYNQNSEPPKRVPGLCDIYNEYREKADVPPKFQQGEQSWQKK